MLVHWPQITKHFRWSLALLDLCIISCSFRTLQIPDLFHCSIKTSSLARAAQKEKITLYLASEWQATCNNFVILCHTLFQQAYVASLLKLLKVDQETHIATISRNQFCWLVITSILGLGIWASRKNTHCCFCAIGHCPRKDQGMATLFTGHFNGGWKCRTQSFMYLVRNCFIRKC